MCIVVVCVSDIDVVVNIDGQSYGLGLIPNVQFMFVTVIEISSIDVRVRRVYKLRSDCVK